MFTWSLKFTVGSARQVLWNLGLIALGACFVLWPSTESWFHTNSSEQQLPFYFFVTFKIMLSGCLIFVTNKPNYLLTRF